MRTLLKIGAGLLLLAFVLIGLTFSVLRAEGSNSGPNPEGRVIASEGRDVGAGVTDINLSGRIDLTLRQGAVPSMIVRGERRLLANVDTMQAGKQLNIAMKGMLLHYRQPMQVVLVLPSLAALTIHGNGDSTANGFSGEHINVRIEGTGSLKFNGRYKDVKAAVFGTSEMEMNGGASDKIAVALIGTGDMTVFGSCKQFSADQKGTGDLDTRHLAAEAVTLKLHGSGDAVVQALKSAAVTVHGSGDVQVLGNPAERSVERNGTGSVTFIQ